MKCKSFEAEDYPAYDALREEGLRLHPEAFGISPEEEAPIRKTRFEAMFNHPTNFHLGAWDGTELVGSLGFVRHHRIKMQHRGDIFGMYVRASHRGRGFGKQLMQVAIPRAFQQPGLRAIHLSVTHGNTSAIGLYESMGFEAYGIERETLAVGGVFYDVVLMRLSRP